MTADPDERRLGVAARIAIFAGTLVVIAVTIGAVVGADIDRRADDGASAAATVTTYASPPGPSDDDDLPTAGSTVPLGPAGPLTGSAIATELEKRVRTETGWTHKVWCEPHDAVIPGDVLSCTASTEPPIKEQAPSNLLVVVVTPDEGIYVRGHTGPYSVDVLMGQEASSCADLLAADYPYTSALAWWLVHNRPSTMLEDGETERPCTVTYGEDAVDAAFAATVGNPAVP